MANKLQQTNGILGKLTGNLLAFYWINGDQLVTCKRDGSPAYFSNKIEKNKTKRDLRGINPVLSMRKKK